MREFPAQLAAKLYAAADLIAYQGLDATKIDDIAEASGIPKATLYYYFTGKEEILSFLLKDLLTSIAGEVAVAVASEESAADRLRAAIRAQLSVMLHNPSTCRALIGDLGRATRLPALTDALGAAFYAPVEKILRDGATDGSLVAVADPALAAVTIFGGVTVNGLMHSINNTDAARDVDQVVGEVADAVARVILGGIGR